VLLMLLLLLLALQPAYVPHTTIWKSPAAPA
jgi:hypothetical protein